jgi:tellurite resistance protein TerC
VELSRTFEIWTLVVLTGLLLFDLALVARRPHVPSLRESGLWVAFYVVLALAFSGLLLGTAGPDRAGEFLAGWATEYSLSVDNLFVFVIIMSRFAVPRDNQQKVLLVGIILSLLLRGVCILLGAAAIEAFSWVFYLFGAFLVYTAVQLLRSHDQEDEGYHENVLIRRVRQVLPISDRYDGARLSTRRMLTPMVVVLLAIGSTDVLFALDSIPAIFGLTQDPFVVFTATLFALMGLRQLYFLLGGLLDRLVHLSKGLSVILAFIGVKLILEALHSNELHWVNGGDPVRWAPVVPIWLSLSVIIGVLALTTVLSLVVAPRRAARREARLAAQRRPGQRPSAAARH